MIKHLITTTEFVKLITKDLTQQDWIGFCEVPLNNLSLIIRYVEFISQKPTFELLQKYFKNCGEVIDNEIIIIGKVGFDEEYLESINSFEDLLDYKLELNDNFFNEIKI